MNNNGYEGDGTVNSNNELNMTATTESMTAILPRTQMATTLSMNNHGDNCDEGDIDDKNGQ